MLKFCQPAYHFSVDWGGTRIGFSEVSGLNINIDVIEYREGSSPENSPTKMPGLRKFTNITLKRGIVKGDNDFFNWINTQQLNTIERRDVVIKLLDEHHQPVVVWKLKNAFPVRYSGPLLQAHSSEVAIEELELTHDEITVETT